LEKGFKSKKKNKFGQINYGYALRYGKFVVVSVIARNYRENLNINDYDLFLDSLIIEILSQWLKFEKYILNKERNSKYFKNSIGDTGEGKIEINYDGYYKGSTLEQDLKEYAFNVTKK